MLRFALIGPHDSLLLERRLVARVRNVVITAIVDTDHSESTRFAASGGPEARAANFDELLSKHATAFDAVLFHSNRNVSEQGFLQVAKAGKHVLYVGMLPVSSTIAGQLVATCRDAGVRSLIGPWRRFAPGIRTIKESLDAGRLGAPGLLRIHRWQPRSTGLQLSAPATSRFPSLLEQLVAEIDLTCWFFGRRPSVIYAVGKNVPSDEHDAAGSPGDYVQLHLGFANGGMALIDLAATLPVGDPYSSLSLIGSTGAAYADDHHNTQLLYGGGSPAALSGGAGEFEDAARLREFVSAIEERREPSPSGNEIVRAMEVAEAAMLSLSTGRVVPMTEDA